MAVSAAAYYEVRWRAKGSDEAWGLPQRVAPLDEVVVTNLDRTQEYEFEVRAVSNCGAKSIWVPSDYTVPDAPPGTIRLDDLSADAAEALAAIANIASDNILSAGEKPVVIRDYNVITTEQAGIDAQATAYGITTEKTAYDGKVSALTSYLATLTSPKLWSDLTGDTTIVGSTFRTRFADVYTTRQALLNAIYAAAKAKADAAQATADTAQFLASQVAVINPGFDAGDTGWTKASGWSIKSDGSFGHGAGYAEKSGGGSSASLRNNAVCFVQPGKSYTVQALIKAIGANGQCYARISWRDLNDSEIGLTNGNLITGTTVAGSYATGQAPVGAVFAHAEIAATGHTAGKYQVDNVISTLQPATADEIAETGSKKWAAETGAEKTTGKSITVLTGRTLDNISDGGGRYAAAEAGADKTRNHVSLGPNAIVNPSGKTGTSLPNYADTGALVAYSHDSNLRPSETSGGSFLYTGTIGSAATIYFNGRTYSANPEDATMVDASPGETWFGRIRAGDWGTGNIGSGRLLVQFRDAAGTYLNGKGITATLSDADLMEYTVSAVAPAGTARVELAYRFYMDGTNTSALLQQAELRKATTSDAGSGVTIGDQRNLVSSITRNIGLVRSATALTARAGGAVDINAHTITMGSASIAYNAQANAVTGLATSSSYYIYTRDNYAGGSPTWAYSTDSNQVNSWDDAYNGGVVTIPTSGSSGGGGGGGGPGAGCVCADMWLRHGLTARQLAERWRWWRPFILRGQDGWHFVRRRPRVMQQPWCRITVADGATLDCSLSTPVTTQTGESVMAPMLHGHLVWTDSGWQRVINVQLQPGERDVVRISVGGHTFLAGSDPHRRISTHNSIKL